MAAGTVADAEPTTAPATESPRPDSATPATLPPETAGATGPDVAFVPDLPRLPRGVGPVGLGIALLVFLAGVASAFRGRRRNQREPLNRWIA